MLVEVHTHGVSTFMFAAVSNTGVDDVRAMYWQKKLGPKKHMDLWRKIPDFTPIDPMDILPKYQPLDLWCFWHRVQKRVPQS